MDRDRSQEQWCLLEVRVTGRDDKIPVLDTSGVLTHLTPSTGRVTDGPVPPHPSHRQGHGRTSTPGAPGSSPTFLRNLPVRPEP